ncbi:hypothetical protein ACLIL3_017770 [Acinetobacter radioresistens]|uniref:hypothetical protein n=1 Tax=Acinetobacter radioresistens TaxID=40216 RepID=UPI003985189C
MSNQQGFRSLSTFKKELHRLKSLFATVPFQHGGAREGAGRKPVHEGPTKVIGTVANNNEW